LLCSPVLLYKSVEEPFVDGRDYYAKFEQRFQLLTPSPARAKI